MKELSVLQKDALVELLNVAFGRAAASLSKLTGHRVQLEVPQVTMCPIDELSEQLRPMVEGDLATVHQIFSGSVVGDALPSVHVNADYGTIGLSPSDARSTFAVTKLPPRAV